MIEVPSKILLDQVYRNGLHSLTRIEVKNTSEYPLIVKLRSNLKEIQFQLTNENFPEDKVLSKEIMLQTSEMDFQGSSVDSSFTSLESAYGTPPTDQIPLSTNTVEASMSLFGQHHQFNQIFNFVNYIDQIELDPFSTKKVIIAFLPDDKKDSEDSAQANDQFRSEEETFDYSEINGVIFFVCFKDSKRMGAVQRQASSKGLPALERTTSLKHRGDSKSSIEFAGLNSSQPDFQVTSKFKSRVCKSVLFTDITSTGLIFEDCIAGGTYFKDFTVNNRSEIELFWILNTVDLSNESNKNWLKFTDYDTGEPLGFAPIPAYSPKRIRVAFKPKDIGEFDYDLQIENQNDSSNIIQTHIHATVRSVLREETLVVSTGNSLDFGDCIAGMWKKKSIVLRNVSDSPLEVSFTADNSSETVFQLRLEESHNSGNEFPGRRLNSKQTSELSGIRGSVGLENASEKYLNDRLQEFSLISRTHSELSVSRTRSSSSSVESNLGADDGDGYSDVITPEQGSNFELSAINPRSEDLDSFNSLDPPIRDNIASLGEEIARIEELIIRPGSERIVDVCYQPTKDPITSDYRACRLVRRNFRLYLSHWTAGKQHEKEKSTIQCMARSCTSAIEVSPKILHFGDTDVGTLKSLPIHIKNCSDLAAIVELRYVSKVLSSIRGEIIIPAKQTLEVKIDIYPRKVNPDYRKEITVCNVLNPANDQVLEVQSTNIDQQRITFHSLYYQILTPQSTHFIDFGTAVLNAPVVRTFIIENISTGALSLDLSTSLDSELFIYRQADLSDSQLAAGRQMERKEKLLETIEVRRKLKRAGDSVSRISPAAQKPPTLSAGGMSLSKRFLGEISLPTPVSLGTDGTSDYLDLASGKEVRSSISRRGTQSKIRLPSRPADDDLFMEKNPSIGRSVLLDESEVESPLAVSVSSPPDQTSTTEKPHQLSDIISELERETGNNPPNFSTSSAEEAFVKLYQSMRRELEEKIDDRQLIPVSRLVIPPQRQQSIVVILNSSNLNRAGLQGRSRKHDSKIFIKMVEFDRNFKLPQYEQLIKEDGSIPVRELMARSFISRSLMELGQKHINFGTLDKTEKRTKRIVIRNRCEIPLLYSIRKSGSIASGDLIFSSGRMGVIRGYSRKEVEFMFDPSLAGPFQEVLTIENVLNPQNNQSLVVKSTIRQQATFNIENSTISFGACLIDQISSVRNSIVITNPSSKNTRVIEVRIDTQELQFRYCTCNVWFSVDSTELETGSSSKLLVTRENEELIEQLEQKLKIAIRKGKAEKSEKIQAQLELLKAGKLKEDLKSTVATGPLNSKLKVNQSSIVISVPPRSIKAVYVHLKPIRRSNLQLSPGSAFTDVEFNPLSSVSSFSNDTAGQKDIPETEVCEASIYVHEQKNTDVTKKVTLQATICYDNSSYMDALENNMSLGRLESSVHPAFPLSSPVPKSSADSELKPFLAVESTLIDIGKVEIGEIKDCYVVINNPKDFGTTYEISADDLFIISPLVKQGFIDGKSNVRIELQIRLRNVGRKLATLFVNHPDSGLSIPVQFLFYGVHSTYLRISNISTEANVISADNKNIDFDFKYCYVDPTKKFAKVVPLKVENVVDQQLQILVSSNLAQQCLIFKDANLDNAVGNEGLLLEKNDSCIVYVALQPGLIISSNAKKHERTLTSASDDQSRASQSAEVRSLIGGIRFNVVIKDLAALVASPPSKKVVPAPDGAITIFTHSLKFSATIGQSILETSAAEINFGHHVEVGKVFKGGFWLFNRTPKIPLHFRLKSNSNNLILDILEGNFPTASSPSSSQENSGIWIGLALSCDHFGFYNHQVSCENLNNSGQKVVVSVTAFIDEKTLVVPQPYFCWENIYVASIGDEKKPRLAIQKRTKEENVPLYELPLEVQNYSEKPITIQVLSDLHLAIRWIAYNGVVTPAAHKELNYPDSLKVYFPVGSVILLNAKQKIAAMVSVPRPLPIVEDSSFDLLHANKKICQRGMLLIQNVETKVHLKALEVSASYCISKGSLVESEIDLGKAGQSNRWQQISFAVNLINNAEIPFCYDIECPDYFSIAAIDGKNETLKRKIPPLGTHAISISFNPKLIDTGALGPMCSKLIFKNLFNPSNMIELLVRFHMTQFELKFDRLQSGELVLPPLTHPSPPNALPCDTWFTVTNISDRDVKFELGYTLAPDVGELISMEIFSRNSNLPITSVVNLAPKASLEVKLRMSAVEKSKLNSGITSSTYLLNPEGITLGTFWVSTKSKIDNLVESFKPNRFAESFPIRGVLVEGKTFTISEKQLVFKSVLLSDSDDENSHGETAKSPVAIEQMQQILLTNLSPVFPLEIIVSVDYPIEFSGAESMFEISPLDSNGIALVAPSSTLNLQLALHKRYIYGVSDDIKVLFTDKNSLSKKPEVLVIKFSEESNARGPNLKVETAGTQIFGPMNHSPISETDGVERKIVPSIADGSAPTLSSHQDLTGLPKNSFELKGCKKAFGFRSFEVEGLYELDAGQQDLSTNPLTKRLTLESSQKMEYRVFALSSTDLNWLTISQSDVHCDSARSSVVSNANNSSVISLTFSLLIRGCWSTYLIIENLENPLDTKFIRVSIEIVGKQNVRRAFTNQASVISDIAKLVEPNRVFDVTTHALDLPETELNIGHVSFGTLYVSRSFIIWNREAAALDFSVSSNIPKDDESEMIISLSRTGAKLFNTVRIDAESHCQIFLRFIFFPQKALEAGASYSENKDIEIYVNCRLVKDYQKVIALKALCSVPQLFVDCTDFVFSGAFRFEEKVTMKSANDYFTIFNQSTAPLEYHIASDSLYFGLDVCLSTSSAFESRSASSSINSTGGTEEVPLASKLWLVSTHGSRSFTIPPNSSQKFRIVPLIENIEKHSEQLKKQKYIQDHFVVYNKNRLYEKERIYVRLSFGHLKAFQFASDSLNHFMILESQCVGFLRTISSSPLLLYDPANAPEELKFLYQYLVDELIHYGTREQAQHRYLRLANLLFKYYLSNRKHAVVFSQPNCKFTKETNDDPQTMGNFDLDKDCTIFSFSQLFSTTKLSSRLSTSPS